MLPLTRHFLDQSLPVLLDGDEPSSRFDPTYVHTFYVGSTHAALVKLRGTANPNRLHFAATDPLLHLFR